MKNDDEHFDLLQVRIEQARAALPEDTRRAIDAVDWRGEIEKYREKRKFTLTQLEDLELETELLLCGLIPPEQYPKEIEERLGISESSAHALVDELNESVFKKIRAELEKRLAGKENTPTTYTLTPETPAPDDGLSQTENDVLSKAGVEIGASTKPSEEETRESLEREPSIEEVLRRSNEPAAPATKKETPAILADKLSGAFQVKSQTTSHTVEKPELAARPTIPKIDPYREIPE